VKEREREKRVRGKSEREREKRERGSNKKLFYS
jgi:hypothetical protein